MVIFSWRLPDFGNSWVSPHRIRSAQPLQVSTCPPCWLWGTTLNSSQSLHRGAHSLQGHACLSGLSSPVLSWLQKRSWRTATFRATPISSPVCEEPHFISRGQALVDCESKPRGTRNKRSPGFPGERHKLWTFLTDSGHTTSTATCCVLSAVVAGVRERLGKGDA